MPKYKIKGLPGLKGLNALGGYDSLTPEQRTAWEREQIAAGKLSDSSSYGARARLFKNQQFANRYGLDAFKKYNVGQRDKILSEAFINDAFDEKYSPYTDKLDKFGNPIADPNKGMGDALEYNKYRTQLSSEGKLELLNSDWLPSNQKSNIVDKIEKATEVGADFLKRFTKDSLAGKLGQSLIDPIIDTSKGIVDTIANAASRGANNRIIEDIYTRDRKRTEEKLEPEILAYKSSVIDELSDNDVDAAFKASITPSETNLGNGLFAANYDKDGNPTSAMENFSIDDKRMYLAKEAVLKAHMGDLGAYGLLSNYAQEYIADNQGWRKLGKLATAIGIQAMSYTSDKVNGILTGYDYLNPHMNSVWVSSNGEVISPDRVKSENGVNYYTDNSGKNIEVFKREMSDAQLHWQGKDPEGNDVGWFLNPQYWTDAERFNTFDEKEIEEYKKLGYSPHTAVFEPGSTSELFYETGKMTGFALADAATTLIPFGIGAAGKALQGVKGASAVAKGIRGAGTAIATTGKVADYSHRVASGMGIGHAYARNMYGEALAGNIQKLEDATYKEVNEILQDRYTNDKNFKAQFDAEVNARYNKLKEIQAIELADGGGSIIDAKSNDKVLMNLATNQVLDKYTKQGFKELQNTQQYQNAIGQAVNDATDAATALYTTDGLKYVLTNFGFRSYLFNTPASLAKESAQKIVNKVTNEGGKLVAKGVTSASLGKGLGKMFWGGAWTNFTDEMQTAGSRQINEDKFANYLSGMYDGEATSKSYSMIDAANSYIKGASANFVEPNTWRAGLIGGLGSMTSIVPNIASISHTLMTKEGRQAWRNASFGEKANMLIANGVLNEYYAQQASVEAVQNAINQVNKLIDENDKFQSISDILAVDLASLDVNNTSDAKTMDFLKALQAMSILHDLENDSSLDKDSEKLQVLKGISRKSSTVQKAFHLLDNILNDKLDEQQAKDLLSEYYSKNPSVPQSEESAANAMAFIKENAARLKKADDLWQKVNDTITQYEDERGEAISPFVRKKILERQALGAFLDERIGELETSITGSSKVSNNTAVESYGMKNAIKKQVRAYERTQRNLEKEIEKATKKYENAQGEYDHYVKTHEDSQDQLDIETIKSLSASVTEAKLQLEYLKEAQDKVVTTIDTLNNTEHTRVLTKDEILMLNPSDRARMLDPKNFTNYSKEQQKQINALRKELDIKDPNLLKSIQEVADYQAYKESNENAYSMLLNNPEAAAVHLDAQRETQAQMAVDTLLRDRAEAIDKTIRQLETFPKANKDSLRDDLYRNFRVLHPSLLEYMLDTTKGEKNLKAIPRYRAELERAKDWSVFVTDLSKAIDQLGLEGDGKKLFATSLQNLIDRADDKNNALKVLEDVTKAEQVSDQDKKLYKKLLDVINGVTDQRSSTTSDTKTQEKAREVKNDTEVEQQKKSIEVAEKEASNEEQSKKAIAQQQAEDKAEAERLKKQEEMAKAQLSQVETAEEREKRKQTEMQTYNLTEEEWENKEKQISTVETPEEAIKKGENVFGDESTDGYDFNTPTLEEQANDSNRGTVEAPVIITEITTDATDQGNLMSSADGLIGNAIYRYDLNKLVNEATEVNRVGAKADDPLNKFLNWMDTAGVKYQEIIDNELSDILKVQPKLNVMYINGQDNATHDNYIGDSPLLVVEYTNEISRIHKDERGGVFQANGKQYLVVGTLGFPRGSHGDIYRALRARHKNHRKAYFAKNPSERFWVVPNEHTEVKQFTSGRIVRQTLNDSKQEIRSVSQLLQDPQRNPKGLKMEDLKWGIQYLTTFASVGVSSRNTVYPPRDIIGNKGKTFLLIEAANGNYIPAAIEAIRWNSNQKTGERGLKDGTLKNQIMSLISELASTKYEDRRRAIDALVKLFYLSKDGDQILIGDKDKPGVPVVSTSKNGVILRSFKLDSETFSIGDLHAAIEELNPRINITTSMLSNPTMLKILDEAGALETDIAKLGTSNSGYSVYDIGADGMPIKDTTVSNGTPNIDANSDLEKYNNKKEHSVTYLGKTYRERNGKWYNNTWNEVTDPVLIEQLQYNNIIRRRDLSPDFVEGTSEYFILNNDSVNPHVIKRNASNMSISTLTEREAKVVVAEMNRRKLEQEKKDRAKAILQSEQAVEVDLGDTETTETTEVTPENIVTGTESQDEIVSNTTVNPAEEVVDEIVTNSRGIHLTDDGKFYVDESGKQYARVTSVISATEGAERMTPDNPWVTPSTTIGTGIDEFVRDFFAKKLGNTDSLSDRYPNATNKQLNEFRKQLEGLRRTFEEKELTVVPRDVTVTGTIEVTDSQGKKYNLDVAGTLDLLAYDTKGNFYIFDMKTSRSKPGHEKGVKWSKQLSLYKQFLESKYGVNVNGTEIIPIQVSYPAPKGFGNSKNEYTAKDGKLYMNGTEYREATPILHNNIPIPTSKVDIKYNLLTSDEVGLLKPLPDGTIDANTGVEKTEVVKTSENSSKVEEQSLAQLQQRKGRGGEPINATSLYRDREFRGRFKEVLTKKGFTGKPSEVNAFLESLNMPTTNITDINSWLDMLENCR